MKPYIWVWTACCLLSAPRSFAGTASVEVWTNSDLETAARKLNANRQEPAGQTFGSFGNHSCALWRRGRTGLAELHQKKTDLLIIQQGHALLRFGGTIPDGKATAPGEVRGASIQGGDSRPLGPGDIIRIPPNTPHQFMVAPGQTITYFALKIEQH